MLYFQKLAMPFIWQNTVSVHFKNFYYKRKLPNFQIDSTRYIHSVHKPDKADLQKKDQHTIIQVHGKPGKPCRGWDGIAFLSRAPFCCDTHEMGAGTRRGQGGGEPRGAGGRRGEQPRALTVDEANLRKRSRAMIRGRGME